jgi:peptidoglycan/xylan/chitin deacetylase (PgdA/CDA1 family)
MMPSSGSISLFGTRLANIAHLAANCVDKPVAVLCYHRVTNKTSDLNSIIVSPENFRAQLEWLKQRYRIVRFEDKWDHRGGPAVAITFDDGYADNLTEALPILEEQGVPATFFISTRHLDSGEEFWWDTLERMLSGKDGYPHRFALEDPKHGRSWNTATHSDRMAMFRDLHRIFMTAPNGQREKWLDELDRWAGSASVTPGISRLMTCDELKILAGNPLATIGAHSVNHQRLAVLTEEEQRREIIQSGQCLEKSLGVKIQVFAYPFGQKSDFNATSVKFCSEAGYRKAAAAFPGLAHSWTDPFMIPRLFVYDWPAERLAVKLKQLWC